MGGGGGDGDGDGGVGKKQRVARMSLRQGLLGPES